MAETIIERARGHLGSAIAQSIPADDQIIMDHVKAAYELLGAIGMHIHRAGSSAGRPADECALCGHDLRHEIHERDSTMGKTTFRCPVCKRTREVDDADHGETEPGIYSTPHCAHHETTVAMVAEPTP